MSPILTSPSPELVRLLATPIALCPVVIPDHRFARSLGTPLWLGVWNGPLRWCGGVLGPNGFLVFTFERSSAGRATENLLDELNARADGFRCGTATETPAEVAQTFADAQAALDRFGAGEPTRFSLPLDFSLGTPFQQRVWQELNKIPWGETISYGELAARVGQPKAARAVGSANGANVLAPVVPCHRVIQAGGRLGGYGGGLPLKSRLLAAEGITCAPNAR